MNLAPRLVTSILHPSLRNLAKFSTTSSSKFFSSLNAILYVGNEIGTVGNANFSVGKAVGNVLALLLVTACTNIGTPVADRVGNASANVGTGDPYDSTATGTAVGTDATIDSPTLLGQSLVQLSRTLSPCHFYEGLLL